MKYNIISYLIGDGIRNISKNKKSTFSAIIIMVVTMLTVGICFVIAENANAILNKMQTGYPLEIYLDDSITVSEREKIENEIRNLEYVNPNIEYISKEQAFHNAMDKLGSDSLMLIGYTEKEHPFPQSYKITFTNLDKLKEVVAQVEEFDHVIGTSETSTSTDVNNVENKENKKQKKSKAELLTSFNRKVNIALVAVGGILVIFSIIIIGNTIKLTVHARRKEISIMKYVGATNNFIRAPFVVEGIVIGIISSLISLMFLAGIYVWIRNAAVGNGLSAWLEGLGISSGFDLLEFSQLFQNVLLIFLAMGIGIGVIGSIWSMKKYLKV